LFTEGRSALDDEGEIKLAVAADKKCWLVRLDFGKPLDGLGFRKFKRTKLGEMLRLKAAEL